MIISMLPGATKDQVEHVCEKIKSFGYAAHPIYGEERVVIGAIGDGKDKDRIIDRMFNSTARIGHNKFAVYVKDGRPVAVMSGSTNWTETGLCTQSNN